MIGEPISSDTYLTPELVDQISEPELKAIATDRGYDIPDNATGRVVRAKFLLAQAKDQMIRKV